MALDLATLRQQVENLKDAPAEARKDMAMLLRRNAGQAMSKNQPDNAFELASLAKQLKAPVENLDYLRGVICLSLNRPVDAKEALKEELRYFPHNQAAQSLLQEIVRAEPKVALPDDAEFKELFHTVRPFTMLSPERLYSLFSHARQILTTGAGGNFVECGVAGGGSSSLLARLIEKYDHSGKIKLFACDSFEGMPEPGAEDVHAGEAANNTGWGSGTCAAPESSVLGLCEQLGAARRITIVKGYFEETLEKWKEQMSPISFLHMDGDWYSSTRAILTALYDCLLPNAYVQVDDYGHWEGCRKAIQEFEQERGLKFNLTRIDGTGVFFRKPS